MTREIYDTLQRGEPRLPTGHRQHPIYNLQSASKSRSRLAPVDQSHHLRAAAFRSGLAVLGKLGMHKAGMLIPSRLDARMHPIVGYASCGTVGATDENTSVWTVQEFENDGVLDLVVGKHLCWLEPSSSF